MGEFELLDENEPLPQRMDRHAFDRLIMLSDGVFAIAMTLSALEIRPPAKWDESAGTLFHMMGPSLAAYAIAFAVISLYWMAHRRMLSRLRRVDAPATVLNLVFLSLIALQPAAIRLILEYKSNGGAGHIYYGQIVLMGVVQAMLWAYAWFIGKLVDPAIPTAARAFLLGNVMVWPVLAAWAGVSLNNGGAMNAAIVIPAVVVVAIGRRMIARRVGLQ